MFLNEGLQDGHQVVCAGGNGAVCVDQFVVESTVIAQLMGKTGTLCVGLAVVVGINHIAIVVGVGFGDHNRLLAGRQLHLRLGEHIPTGGCIVLRGVEIIQVYQHIAIFIQLLQNGLEFFGGHKVLLIGTAVGLVSKCPTRIRNQHMEGKIGNLGGIPGDHSLQNLLVLCPGLHQGREALCVTGEAVQGGKRAFVIIIPGLRFCPGDQIGCFLFPQYLLHIHGCGGSGAAGGFRGLRFVGAAALDGAADNKYQHQHDGDCQNNSGQVGLFKNLEFGALSALGHLGSVGGLVTVHIQPYLSRIVTTIILRKTSKCKMVFTQWQNFADR